MNSESMLDQLDRYHQGHGISPVDFKCPNVQKCRSVCSQGQMATAEAPYVGPGYEEGILPRLLFVSSDTCQAWYMGHPEWVTLESIRKLTLEKGLGGRSPNTHWYQTFALAQSLLAPFAKDTLGLNDVVRFFAHTRSVRCKDGSIGTREGSDIMAINCRGFLKGEIEILQPDIIVTQGKRAKNSLAGAFPVIRRVAMPGHPNTFYQIVQVAADHTAVMIVAKHPCARGRNWKRGEKKQFIEWATKSVREVFPDKRNPSTIPQG